MTSGARWSAWRAAGVALGLWGASCDHGRDWAPPGQVHLDDLCASTGAPAAGCPACSIADAGGGCRDRWYESAWRCDASAPDDRGAAYCASRGGACVAGYCVLEDRDENGIDDAFEAEVVRKNLPLVWVHPDEDCPRPRGVVYRVRHHPDAPSRLAIVYAVLWDRDCGRFNGHLGDRESFGITVDLDAAPGPAATTGVLTIAHWRTACESRTTCVAAPGTRACAPPGGDRVVLYSSRDKHSHYFDLETCGDNCLDSCAAGQPRSLLAALNASYDAAPLVGAGEPDAPLLRDLSLAPGFVQAADGWDPRLLHYDPWGDVEFGGAGTVRDALELILPPAGPP